MTSATVSEPEVDVFQYTGEIPDVLHPVCESCTGWCRKKYSDFMSDTGMYYKDGFAVDCPFIPPSEDFIPLDIAQDKSFELSDDERDHFNALNAALLWGEKHLIEPDTGRPWRAWPYQRGPLLCNCPRKVYRFGRRTGKCIPNHSTIALSNGSLRRIGDLIGQEITVNSLDLNTYEFVRAKATVHDNGIKHCVRIITKYGQEIECTLNHPLLTCDGWKSIDTNLSIGDRIAVPITNPNIGTETFDKNQLNLLGYLLGDGSFRLGNNSVGFTVSTKMEDQKDHFLSLLDGTYRINPTIHCNCYDIRLHVNNSIVQLIRDTGLINKNSHTKFIPDFIYRLDAEHLIEFLWPLFTTDGWLDNRGNIGYCSASKDLAVGVRRLLARLGIIASTRSKVLKSGKYKGNTYYVTEVNNNSEVQKFLSIVGLKFKGYEGKTITSRNSYNSQVRSMPLEFSNRFAKKLKSLANTIRQREKHGYVRENRQVGRKVLTKWAHELPVEFSEEIKVLDSDLYWDEIVSIEDLGEVQTAGLQVPGNQNYINDVVEHNTTILAVEILWYLFTSCGGTLRDEYTNKVRTNLKVLLLAPQKTHIENIFDRIRAFMNLSPALKACEDRNKRGSPQVLSFSTSNGGLSGNMVSGYASGDSSGGNGLSARGQDADLVVLDEGAFIGAETIEAVINPILYTKPTTRLIISSTPSGIPGDYFESICTKRPDFAEFYVPASARPDWETVREQVKKDFGSNQEQWDKEVMALFSPAGIGVYREDLISTAQHKYKYGSLPKSDAFIYTIGVDWNKEHGTEVIVLGTQKHEPHISFVIAAETIDKKDFTAPRGIEKIVELNRFWQPAWIYVDAGGGDGGQMLRHHGRSMAGKHILDGRLMNIVKDYNFGGKVEVREYDGTISKFHAKAFMVENSVKKFEIGEFRYPESDLTITRQLNNYIIERRQPNGTPVYGMKEKKWGDHRLDSINLALVAIRLEFPSFSTGKISPLGIPIAHIGSNEPNKTARTILPKAIGNNPISRSAGRTAISSKRQNVVTWGESSGRVDKRGAIGPFGQPVRKLRFGR